MQDVIGKGDKKSVFHIEDLKYGNVCGVLEVASFSPSEIVLKISAGRIEICGSLLEITAFSVESGDLAFHGEISSVALKPAKTSFFQRLTK